MKAVSAIICVSLIVSVNYVESLRRVKRIIGGTQAQAPPTYHGPEKSTTTTTPSPVARPTQKFVDKEERSAVVKGVEGEDGVNSFLGLRYAEAPVGRLRFQRPRRIKLRGEVDATRYGPPCPQWSPYPPRRIIGSEDCLFLNVYAPQTPGKYPVLLWVHGGNFQSGSGAQYYPRDVVKKGLVVVTLNYRLGSLGYLSNGRKHLPGNVGLFDIATAAKWVKSYVAYFGGDPERIVLGGQGSGASSATLLAVNDKSRRASKYSGILAMSGTPVSPFVLDENEVRTAEEVSAEDGCKVEDGKEFVRCMQKLPLEQILAGDGTVGDKRKNQNDFPKGLANLNGPGPREEGKDDGRFLPNFIPMSPLEAIKKGLFPKGVPLMTGVTSQETGRGIKGNFLKELTSKLLSPSFLQSGIFTKALEANTGLYVNKTVNPQLSALFLNGDYLKIFTQLIQGLLSDVEVVIKHTTDAFFNLPAFITSTLWAKKNKVFLYSFEHIAKKSPISQILPNIPLSSSQSSDSDKKGAEHGDDLAYLFDIRSLEGEPVNDTSLDEVDEKVKDHFTTAVCEFARSGKPKTQNLDDWQPFKSQSGDYLIFNEEPKMAKNFHKCEMGLWTGDGGLLSSPECSFLQATEIVKNTLGSAGSSLLSAVDSVEGRLGIPGLTNSLSGTSSTLKNLTNPNLNPGSIVPNNPLTKPLGGLLSGNPSNAPSTTKTTKKPGFLGVGGLLG
uniref:Carboxylesterase 4A n=2 Tax=Lygus hesperus TaxID=30085 RepID=A0A0A9Y730_LYGHE